MWLGFFPVKELDDMLNHPGFGRVYGARFAGDLASSHSLMLSFLVSILFLF